MHIWRYRDYENENRRTGCYAGIRNKYSGKPVIIII